MKTKIHKIGVHGYDYKTMSSKLVIYQSKIAKFKKEEIGKYNPYQATKLPPLEKIKKYIPKVFGGQIRNQIRNQVWNQVGGQIRNQVWNQVADQVWNQVWNQVADQVWNQVGDQVWNQVEDQVWSVSYWVIIVVLGLPIKHWFFDFLKLGIMIVFVKGKVKVFGKKGKYLGEYDMKDFK